MTRFIALLTALLFSCSATFAQQYTAPIGTTSVQISGANTTSTGSLQVESSKMFGSPTPSEYATPTANSLTITSGTAPRALCYGSDNNLYGVEFSGNNVFQMTAAGAFTEFAIPTASSQPAGICQGSDGNLYGVEYSGNNVFQMTTAGVFTEFPIPTAASNPISICQGSDGNLYGVEKAGNKVFQMTTAGVFTEFSIPTASSQPVDICQGSDGNLYGVEYSGNNVFQMTTAGVFTEFSIPTAPSNPVGICQGRDNYLYVCESNMSTGAKVARMTRAGSFSEFSLPASNSSPESICQGSDGNLYGVETSSGNIFMMTPAGAFIDYSIPSGQGIGGAHPISICQGGDGNLYGLAQNDSAVFVKSNTSAWTNITQAGAPLSQTNGLPVKVAAQDKATYIAGINNSGTGVSLATTATDFFTITGSATKTIKILQVFMYVQASAVQGLNVALVRRSTVDSGGTPVSVTPFSLDSQNTAATATVNYYTANPTLGTKVADMGYVRLLAPATTFAPGPYMLFDAKTYGQPIVLRGTSDQLALNAASVTGTVSQACPVIIWTEE